MDSQQGLSFSISSQMAFDAFPNSKSLLQCKRGQCIEVDGGKELANVCLSLGPGKLKFYFHCAHLTAVFHISPIICFGEYLWITMMMLWPIAIGMLSNRGLQISCLLMPACCLVQFGWMFCWFHNVFGPGGFLWNQFRSACCSVYCT